MGVNVECGISNPTKYKVTFYLVYNAIYSTLGLNVIIIDQSYV